MKKVMQVHFKTPIKKGKLINKAAKLDGITTSKFYRKAADRLAKHEKFIRENRKFNHELDRDYAPIIHSNQELNQWLKK